MPENEELIKDWTQWSDYAGVNVIGRRWLSLNPRSSV